MKYETYYCSNNNQMFENLSSMSWKKVTNDKYICLKSNPSIFEIPKIIFAFRGKYILSFFTYFCMYFNNSKCHNALINSNKK